MATKALKQVYTEKGQCCGCYACYSICPKEAIVMTQDEEGFYYPKIDQIQCIGCGICIKVCPFTKQFCKLI